MQWIELTAEEFPRAREAAEGVCLLPMGCIERHSTHLPLGTDQIIVDEVARRAAELEPAVVFPSYYMGTIFVARPHAGTFSPPARALLDCLRFTVEEIARNGFRKLIICNGHGGNIDLVRFFLRSLLAEDLGCAVYSTNCWHLEGEDADRWREMRDTEHGGHACEMETSTMLAVRPDLVHMDAVDDPANGRPRGHQAGLEGLDASLRWYADYPTHYAGDARPSTAEKGQFLVDACVRRLARQIRAAKADEWTLDAMRRFHESAEDHS